MPATPQLAMAPSLLGPSEASSYSLDFKNSKEIRENHKPGYNKISARVKGYCQGTAFRRPGAAKRRLGVGSH